MWTRVWYHLKFSLSESAYQFIWIPSFDSNKEKKNQTFRYQIYFSVFLQNILLQLKYHEQKSADSILQNLHKELLSMVLLTHQTSKKKKLFVHPYMKHYVTVTMSL